MADNASPKIEDTINRVLSGDALRNALDFTAFLSAHEMSPVCIAENVWNIHHNEKCICVVLVDGTAQMPGPWTIWSDGDCDFSNEQEDFPFDEDRKEIVWANVNKCGNCGSDCSPGKRKTIFGKEFDNVCSSTIAFTNPDGETLECAKKLIEMQINAL